MKAFVLARYKNNLGIVIVYAVAETKDGKYAYFFKKEEKDTNTNLWLTHITNFAKNMNLNEIDQTSFFAQFSRFDEIGKTFFVHKLDKNLMFSISN